MSAKKLDYRDLSDKLCVVCKEPLKKNLVNKNPKANMCWKHYQMLIRKRMPLDDKAKSSIYNFNK